MFLPQINIIYFILFHIVVQIQSLLELPAVEDDSIKNGEAAIRSAVNDIFAAFRIKNIYDSPKLKQFSTIHNFFVSITLTDCDNLKQISRLTRVNDVDKNTIRFIALLNEALNDDVSEQVRDKDVYVTEHITTFIDKLKYLKEKYVALDKAIINPKIIQYIDNDKKPMGSVMNDSNISKMNESDENVVSDENDFWRPNSRRIYKGIRTRVRKFPFMASVQFFKRFQCAGSIIGDDVVITSASCLQLAWNNRFFRENPAFLSVLIGSNYYEGGGENIAVLEVYFYPTYDPKTLANNLAIMRLSRKIKFKKKKRRARKIDIDRNPWQLPENTESITVVGWGAKESSNVIYDSFRQKLSYAELDFYPLSECREHYSKEYVTRKNFCGGFFSKGSGACNRDAGGPGIVGGILTGVISFGSPVCGAPDSPTVFTKLGYYADWIDGILEQHVHHSKKRTTLRPPRTRHTDFHIFTTDMVFTPIHDKKPFPPASILDMDRVVLLRDKGFRDFLKTMFEKDELKEYLAEDSPDTKKEFDGNQSKKTTTKTTTKEIKTTKKKTKKHKTTKKKAKKPKIEREHVEIEDVSDTSTGEDEGGSEVGMDFETETTITAATTKPAIISTTLDQTTAIPPDTAETVTEATKSKTKETTTELAKVTVIENASNEDKTLEEDIMALIDNLDIDKLLEETKDLITTENPEIVEKSTETTSIVTTEETTLAADKIDIESIAEPVLNYLFLSKENNDTIDENIEVTSHNPLKDLTLRELVSNSSQKRDVLSETLFYDLVALAIEDERKRLKKLKNI
ncbi:uncharacterized protein LOC142982857 [Anticarsia gemmatalis]|uniref:uncharacterized protein LOC142982857 n=1 Tax=Anticarsia gemmatalis TaxID=129554 RepID=UPI003F75A557